MNTFCYTIVLIILAGFSKICCEAQTYKVTEWANDPVLTNSVGLSIDDKGKAYLTVSKGANNQASIFAIIKTS